MATSEQNLGTCLLCNEKVLHRTAKKHVLRCIELLQSTRNRSSRKGETFLVKVTAGKHFWLYVDINAHNTLADLDDLLKKTWLEECCDHLSCFVMSGTQCGDNTMSQPVQSLFYDRLSFTYRYDFGNSTILQGEVVAVRPGELQQAPELVAQNTFPSGITCDYCQARPQHICSICGDCFCNHCLDHCHNNCEGNDCLLPVVNSPRMGVCGYTGPAKTT